MESSYGPPQAIYRQHESSMCLINTIDVKNPGFTVQIVGNLSKFQDSLSKTVNNQRKSIASTLKQRQLANIGIVFL